MEAGFWNNCVVKNNTAKNKQSPSDLKVVTLSAKGGGSRLCPSDTSRVAIGISRGEIRVSTTGRARDPQRGHDRSRKKGPQAVNTEEECHESVGDEDEYVPKERFVFC